MPLIVTGCHISLFDLCNQPQLLSQLRAADEQTAEVDFTHRPHKHWPPQLPGQKRTRSVLLKQPEPEGCCHRPPCAAADITASFPSRTSPVRLWLAVAAAVRMWSPQRSAFYPTASTGEDEMFFPLPPVPLPPSEHHPVLHLPHRR